MRNRDCISYPGVGTFVLIRPAQTFYERINLEGSDSGTRVANILERVSMMGLPIGLLVKLPFLPFPYMVRSTMTASEKKLLHSLNP